MSTLTWRLVWSSSRAYLDDKLSVTLKALPGKMIYFPSKAIFKISMLL